MEKLFYYLTNHKRDINEVIFAYIVGTVTNVISGANFDSVGLFLAEFMKLQNFSVLLMWLALIMIIIINFIIWPLSKKAYHKNKYSYKIAKIIRENTSECFKDVIDMGGYSWGENRTLHVASNVFAGYKSENIMIERYVSEPYIVQPGLKEEYEKYLQSKEAKTIIKKKNNNPRYMVIKYESNYSKTDKNVYLTLQKTDWLTLRFYWNYYRNKGMAERQKDIFNLFHQAEILPNSFCLHLILVTKNDEVIVTAISRNKSNDYPLTWAVTIGEQIEETDFDNGVDFDADFTRNWIQRALLEEFGIYKNQFEAMVPDEGIKVLSLDAEGDIYNVSMLTVVHLNVGFEEFLEEIQIHPEIDKEFAQIDCIKIKDIPKVMAQYEDKSSLMHPSSYLRLLMCYLHRYGVNTFVNEYENAQSNKQKIRLFYDNV